MKVLFCWWTFEGYFAASWRALAARPGVEVSIIALRPNPDSIAPHDPAELAGLDARLESAENLLRTGFWLEQIRQSKPDVIVIPGWMNSACIRAVTDPSISVPLIMATDRAWTGSLRQRLGRFRHRRLFSRVDHVVGAGKDAAELARRLGIPPDRISRGMYGVDTAQWGAGAPARAAGPWPRSFLFVGRYHSDKGVEFLAQAYKQYRASTPQPWTLRCCGRGPLGDLLKDAGAEDLGFLRGRDLAAVMGSSGAFVLPSVFEPWGVALIEAAAAGLPLICTPEVRSIEEVGGPDNAIIVPPKNANALAAAMRTMHDRGPALAPMGERSRTLAATQDIAVWAKRWDDLFQRVIAARSSRSHP